jgi:hypothetical protein
MADKYLKTGTGSADHEEQEAQVTSSGAGDAGKIIALDGAGKLDSSLFPSGFGSSTLTIEASEALSAGDFVNVWDDAGTAKMRKADATTTGKAADGFVLSSVTSGANGTFYALGESNDALTGLTVGAIYYLDTTAGTATTTRPSSTGNIIQRLGRAVNATTIDTGDYTTIEVA